MICEFCGVEHGAELFDLAYLEAGQELVLHGGREVRFVEQDETGFVATFVRGELGFFKFSPSCVAARVVKVLWVSDHEWIQLQDDWIKKVFGPGARFVRGVSSWRTAADIARKFWEGGYDDMAVVAPQTVLDHLCRQGLRPLRPVTPQVRLAVEADFSYNGRHFRFLGFERVEEVIVRTSVVTSGAPTLRESVKR